MSMKFTEAMPTNQQIAHISFQTQYFNVLFSPTLYYYKNSGPTQVLEQYNLYWNNTNNGENLYIYKYNIKIISTPDTSKFYLQLSFK